MTACEKKNHEKEKGKKMHGDEDLTFKSEKG